MAKIRHKGTLYQLPHFKLYRDGIWKPRFEPSPSLRKSGWNGYALQDDTGEWLDIETTIKKATKQLADIEAWRAGDQQQTSLHVRPNAKAGTLARLFCTYRADDAYRKDIGKSTRRQYRYALKAMETAIGDMNIPIASFEKPAAYALYKKLRRKHGLASANHHMRVLKRVFQIGGEHGLVRIDPMIKFRMKSTKPRVRFVETEEISHLIATADAMGLPSIGDTCVLAITTGQRSADILKFPINLANKDEHEFKQGKRGKIITLRTKLLNRMRPRLHNARRRAIDLSRGVTPTKLLIYEGTGRPYADTCQLSTAFRKVRVKAGKTMPSLLGLNDDGTPMMDRYGNDIQKASRATLSDFRDTLLTTMILAECTLSEVCSLLGHEEKSALEVWKHYKAERPEISISADDKMAKYCASHGLEY